MNAARAAAWHAGEAHRLLAIESIHKPTLATAHALTALAITKAGLPIGDEATTPAPEEAKSS